MLPIPATQMLKSHTLSDNSQVYKHPMLNLSTSSLEKNVDIHDSFVQLKKKTVVIHNSTNMDSPFMIHPNFVSIYQKPIQNITIPNYKVPNINCIFSNLYL